MEEIIRISHTIELYSKGRKTFRYCTTTTR